MSLAQIRREINAIKRKLVHELRVVRARRVVNKYCDLWADLVARNSLPPGPFRLVKNLLKHTDRPGDFARASDYLEQCRVQRHLPYPDAILYQLLHREADMGLISSWAPDPVKY